MNDIFVYGVTFSEGEQYCFATKLLGYFSLPGNNLKKGIALECMTLDKCDNQKRLSQPTICLIIQQFIACETLKRF